MFYHFIDTLIQVYYREDSLAGARRNGYAAISEAIIKGYVIDKLSASKIASIIDKSSADPVIRWLRRFKIPIRPRGGARLGVTRPPKVYPRIWAYDTDALAAMSGRRGARTFQCSRHYFYIIRREVLYGHQRSDRASTASS